MELPRTSKAALELPLPRLSEGRFASISAYTDPALFEACGVRIAFTKRHGGVSSGAYESLNLGSHVNDDLASVLANRRILLEALGFDGVPCVVPVQVHGREVLKLASPDQAEQLLAAAKQDTGLIEYDAVTVGCANVAAQLNFADCVPVIAVAPGGAFSVIHAGWRGVDNQISVRAVEGLAADTSAKLGCSVSWVLANTNVYIGPHIMGECFETSAEIHDGFVRKFGDSCSVDERHIELSRALEVQLTRAGVSGERIANLGICTVCNNDEFFSYRGQGGVCGRHGAFACRKA